MVDVITNTIPKGNSTKLSVEQDYEQNKDSGNFVYDSNKKRSSEESNVNVEMPKPRPQPPTVDDTVGDKSINIPQPDDTEGDRSIIPPSTDDTETVTKDIIRGPSPTSDFRDLRKRSLKKESRTDYLAPVITPRGITSYEGQKAGLDSTEMRKEAEIDLINQRSIITIDQLKQSIINNDIPKELTDAEKEKVETAYIIGSQPDATQEEKIASERAIEETTNLLNLIRKDTAETQPSIAFSRSMAEFNPTEKAEQLAALGDFDLINRQEYYFESRKELYKVVKGVAKGASIRDQALIEGILLDNIVTGEFWDTTIEGLNEVSRGFLQLPNLVLDGVYSSGVTIFNYATKENKSLSEAWDDTKGHRESVNKMWSDALEQIDAGSLSSVINDVIYKSLKKKMDDGEISEEKFKELTEIRVDKVNTVNGRQVTSTEIQDLNFVDENEAQIFLNEAVNQMTISERYGMIALETFLSVGGMAKGNIKGAGNALKKLRDETKRIRDQEIKKGNKKYIKPQSPLKLYSQMRKDQLIDEFDMKLIDRAFRFEGNQSQYKGMLNSLKNLKDELRSPEFVKLGPKNSTYIKKQREIKSLEGKVFRNFVFGNAAPILKESLEIALPAAVTQLIATQLFAGRDGLTDFYTAQGFGALFHMTGALKLPFAKGLTLGDIPKFPFRYVKNQALPSIGKTISEIFAVKRLEKINSNMPSIFKAQDLNDYERIVELETGRKLTRAERKGAGYIFRMISYLDKEDTKKLLDNMDSQIDLEDAILRYFPEEERAELGLMIAAPFAQVSDLSFLKGAYALTGSKLSAGDFESWDRIKQLQTIADREDETVKFLAIAVDKMREKLSGRTDIENPAAVEKFIEKYDKIVREHEVNSIKRNESLNEDIIKINEIAFLDLDGKIDATTAENLLNASVESRMKINKELSRGQALEKQVEVNYGLLQKRADLIKKSRKDDGYFAAQDQLFELVMETHIQSYLARGKSGYASVDKMALTENKLINLSDLALDYKAILQDETPLRKFFNSKSIFWDSTLNKKLLVSMEEMAERTLSKLDPELLNKMKAMANNPKSNYSIPGYDGNNLDLMLMLQEKGDIKGFNATPSETMDLLASFKDFSMRQKDPQIQRLFFQQTEKLKNMIREQYPEFGEALDKANENYKREVFDRVSGAGPLSDFIKSKDRTTNVGESGSTFYRNTYKAGRTPDKILKPLISDITKFMKDRDLDVGKDIRNKINEIKFQLSDFEDGNPVPVFNLDDPRLRTKFEVIKSMLTEQIYARWGDKVTRQLSNMDPRIRKQLNERNGGYNFAANDRKALELLDELSQVDVIRNGVRGQESLINFTKLVEDEKDIVKLVGENNVVLEKYDNFKVTGNAKINNILKSEQQIVKLRDETLVKLQKLTGTNSSGFYDKYILNGTVENLRKLRDDALSKKTMVDGVPQSIMKEEDFQDVILYWFTNGMFERAGRQTMKGVNKSKIKRFDGTYAPAIGFTSPEVIMGDFSRKNVKAIYEEILGVDHSKFMVDLMDLVDRESQLASNLTQLGGVIRPISGNELISRGFNLARGMVSPTYVAAELALRLASGAGIEMLKLAAQNKDAARIMRRMIKYPEKLQKVELDELMLLMRDFLFVEFARMNIEIPDFVFELVPDFGEEEDS